MIGIIRTWAECTAASFGLYMALIDKLDWQEAIAGLVGAGVAGLAATVTLRTGKLDFEPRLAWLRIALRLPWRVLADCVIVLTAICGAMIGRRTAGRLCVIEFHAGGENPLDAARRALVTAGVCISPNTYVVAIDAERDRLLVHQLVPSGRPPGRGDREWPI